MKKEMQISLRLRTTLLHEMRCGIYKDCLRLPPEVKIAETLGVSRTILRDALASLEREGFISRKHGMGTVVNRAVLDIATRMDIDTEFLSMIREAGKNPSQAFLHSRRAKASEEIAAQLEIKPGDDIFEVVRLLKADDEPAVLCIDSFPKKLLLDENYDENVLREPVFNFLSRYCGVDVHLDITEVRAVNATKELAEYLSVQEGSALLYFNELDYDFFGKPVLSSQQYFRDCALHHTLVRQKL